MGPIPYPPPGDGDPSDSGNVDDSDLPARQEGFNEYQDTSTGYCLKEDSA